MLVGIGGGLDVGAQIGQNHADTVVGCLPEHNGKKGNGLIIMSD